MGGQAKADKTDQNRPKEIKIGQNGAEKTAQFTQTDQNRPNGAKWGQNYIGQNGPKRTQIGFIGLNGSK